MVTSIDITDTPPQMDPSIGYTSDTLSGCQEPNGSLTPVELAEARLNPATKEIDIVSEFVIPKYVSIKMELHNPNDVMIQNYFFQHFLSILTEDGENYTEATFPNFYNEPVYLDFNDYAGKGAYQLDLDSKETRTVTAVYLALENELEQMYLKVSGNYGDGTTTCYDNYIKLTP